MMIDWPTAGVLITAIIAGAGLVYRALPGRRSGRMAGETQCATCVEPRVRMLELRWATINERMIALLKSLDELRRDIRDLRAELKTQRQGD